MNKTLSAVIHAESGSGKSWLADTGPKPALVLDAEGGSRFTRSRKKLWNPLTEAPPEVDGTWDTAVVFVHNYSTMTTVHQWLASGQHPFRSLSVDSLTEIQKRCLDDIAGTDQPVQQDWGALLRHMEDLVRKLRDLAFHPTRPLDSVVILALTHLRDGRFRPMVKGQLELTLPGFVDLVGYLYPESDQSGQLQRKLLVQPLGQFLAKDRTDFLTERYGPVLPIRNPKDPNDQGLDIERMLITMNQETT